MNKQERNEIMALADLGDFGGQLAEMSGDLGHRIREDIHKGGAGTVFGTKLECAALVYWQAMMLNGEWCGDALAEVMDFIKHVKVL